MSFYSKNGGNFQPERVKITQITSESTKKFKKRNKSLHNLVLTKQMKRNLLIQEHNLANKVFMNH